MKGIPVTVSESNLCRKLTVNLDQQQLNVRPVIKAAINEASNTLTDAFVSNKALEWSARNLDPTKRDHFLVNLFKTMIDTASLQSRDFAVQVDGCRGVLVWSDRSQLFSWPQTISTFKYARLLGWTAALKTLVKLQSSTSEKTRRKLMAGYPRYIAIGFIGILPQEQHKGLGTALMEYVLNKADESHYPVYVEATDPQAVKFFERFGFVSHGQISLGKDQTNTSLTPMIRSSVAMNEPKSLRIRPGRQDSDRSL
ncbi:uncharacterized protein B0P05DRAFT_534042 [Gilbertella persicaria]|uniref:uncharacterized protein n=1 Tax=Gilbertella persicaria TaxID=101096 RepID=UPI00222028D6|nr:uncharacterized protein B0P05DRAFT_534042 [Gilbertella persicaria]KAI8085871.1 hypothetical protein B0P05DRAFT_534042 [Gilbertella persicaria]